MADRLTLAPPYGLSRYYETNVLRRNVFLFSLLAKGIMWGTLISPIFLGISSLKFSNSVNDDALRELTSARWNSKIDTPVLLENQDWTTWLLKLTYKI